MVFGWDDSQNAHEQVYQEDGDNKAKFSHELVAGAAAFEGFRLFENHQRSEGKPVSHAFAKEVLAGFAGGEADKLAETKGLNAYDRERARHQARETSGNLYDQHYVDEQNADQYDPNQYGAPQRFQNYGRNQNEGDY